MDEVFNYDELSAEDQAILRAFDAMDMGDWEVESPTVEAEIRKVTLPLTELELKAELLSPEEMLALFAGEADEDLNTIQQTLRQLEPDDDIDVARLQVIQRTAHKLKGTTGAMGCMAMSTIARHIEMLIKLLTSGSITPFIGLNALTQTVRALEMTLNSFVTYGEESNIPLTELEEEYKTLNIDIRGTQAGPKAHRAPTRGAPTDEEQTPVRVLFKGAEEDDSTQAWQTSQEYASSAPFVRVDIRRFEQLVLHTERLAELSAPLGNTQAEVEKALQQLQVAQARLRHLEALLSTHLSAKKSNNTAGSIDERPTSSLVARILDESAQRTGHLYQRKSKFQAQTPKPTETLRWDELEIDRFPENDVLAHSLGEAIADVATASSQLRVAFAQFSRIAQKHIDQAANVRSDTLLLRLTPMSALCSRIERAVLMSTLAQRRKVLFEVEGETTEIDQDILEDLKHPLLQLVRTCVANSSETVQAGETDSIWLHVRAVGNEVSIEVGFSMTVGGGALDEVQEAIRRLNGSISARRNAVGGISFYLRLPRSYGAVQGLLVRAGSHHIVVPFSQLQGIVDGRQNPPAGHPREVSQAGYSQAPPANVQEVPQAGHLQGMSHIPPGHPQGMPLHFLLGFPGEQGVPSAVGAVLVLQSETNSLAKAQVVQVDEILGDVELVVKPLAPHLQRPGIAGSAIDGMGNVLLVLDLPELVRHHALLEPTQRMAMVQNDNKQAQHPGQARLSILIADDSVYIRQSLRQTLSHAGYQVTEADDGMEALEHLLDNPPHALVLDMEMPNLNGYELLSMMRIHPELANVKIVMLTSRSSEKHQMRARELGAHAYLTKPCPQDQLLETLRLLL